MTQGTRWEPPKAWWRRAEAVHGRGPTPKARITSVPLGELFDRTESQFEAVLDHPSTPPELVSAGRAFIAAHRDGGDGVSALGAAVAWIVATSPRERTTWAPFIASIIASSGAEFAARVVVLGASLVEVYHPIAGEKREPNVSLAFRDESDVRNLWLDAPHSLARSALAALPDDDYAAAVSGLAEYRGVRLGQDLTLSFLLPTQQDWVLGDIARVSDAAEHEGGWLGFSLLSCVTTVAGAEAVFGLGESRDTAIWRIGMIFDPIYSMCCYVGPGSEHLVGELFDGNLTADHKKKMAAILADFDTDAGMRELINRLDQKYIEPALLNAMSSAPERAARLLAEASTPRAGELLADLRRLHQPTGSAETASAQAPDENTATDVPLILVDPPWKHRAPYPAAISTEGIARSHRPLAVVWRPGERDDWLTMDADDREEAQTVRPLRDDLTDFHLGTLAYGDESRVRQALPDIGIPYYLFGAARHLRRILARFEVDAADYVLRVVLSSPARTAGVLLPVDGSAVGEQMIAWLSAPSLRPVVYEWHERHMSTAAADLVIAAVTASGAARSRVCALLNEMGRRGHRDVLLAAAGDLDGEVPAAARDILDTDPLMQLPNRIPRMPEWLTPTLLPPVRLVGDGARLPDAAVSNVLTMLAMSTVDDVYAGIDIVRELIDLDDLAELAWAVFERWSSADHPTRQAWALDALGIVGNDRVVRRLTPFVQAWPLQSAHRRAEKALDVLSGIGTDSALSHLWRISQDVKYPALRRKADERIRQIADRLELSSAELADRMIPDLGLDARGSTTIDVGLRSYVVGFDEKLRIVVTDDTGGRYTQVPKPAASDPPASHDAYRRYLDIRSDIKRLGPELIERLENAMVAQRSWPMREVRERFVAHPLMWHLVGRLVWATDDGRLFRFSEVVREPVDLDGDAVTVGDAELVTIPHPLMFSEQISNWRTEFDVDTNAQPFDQVHRTVYRADPADALSALEGMKVSTRQLVALKSAGWVRERPQDKGAQIALFKMVDGRCCATMMVFPGFNAANVYQWPQQKIVHAFIHEPLGPVEASELHRDLDGLDVRPLEPGDAELFRHP